MLAIIVVAGFASTIFMPLTGILVDRYGWRTALLLLAALHGAVTVPLHAMTIRSPPRPPPHTTLAADRATVVRVALRDRRFWWLATAFVTHSAAMSVMTVHPSASSSTKATRPPLPPPLPVCSACFR